MSHTIYLQDNTFCCEKILREVPGNRVIYSGKWQEQDVIVKKFLGRKGKRRMRREVKGLVGLNKRNIRGPRILFYGKNSVGDWCIVTEYIAHGKNMKDLWGMTQSLDEKEKLLQLVIATIAEHHHKKVLQRDLHLGNFLLAKNKVFTLDPAQIKFGFTKLNRGACLYNLAILAAAHQQFSAEYFLENYTKHRQWCLRKKESANFSQQVRKISSIRVQKILKKYLRKNTRHHHIQTSHVEAIVDKSLCKDEEVLPLIKEIKSFCHTQQNSHLMNFRDRCVTVTRYIDDRKAKRSWCNAHHLQILGFYLPDPMAYIKDLDCSFTLSQSVSFKKISDLEKEQSQDNMHKSAMNQVMDFIAQMKKNQIIHNDLFNSLALANDHVFLLNTEEVVFCQKNYDDMYQQMVENFHQQIGGV
ncbi:hypothetical protein [Candidatus Uabimicrobium amorphum]|uniref:Serine/threonine protein kinase n=1 Tax=Uabimicrobium amorphum TaxID=2596890 RepID=A0A5S9IJD5_UABAM|nr:hypothetical protein [Candidatus Uabimicrobium amorphum]BBM82969.1 serine/threonine protein kinase [Candidatus Uabimicrobium amorphum]